VVAPCLSLLKKFEHLVGLYNVAFEAPKLSDNFASRLSVTSFSSLSRLQFVSEFLEVFRKWDIPTLFANEDGPDSNVLLRDLVRDETSETSWFEKLSWLN
jgi:hypothetical protein